MKYKRVLFFYIIFFVGAALAFGFGYLIRAIQDTAKPLASELPILVEAYDILKNHAYDDLPADPALEYGMIRGMVEAYGDPYTRFLEPVEHELETNQLEGRYGGIGSGLAYDPDGYVILHPFPEGPATEAGILDGDRLVSVDTWEVLPNIPIDEVVAAIRGPEGESVTIEVARPPDYKLLTFKIKRQDIPLPSVTWNIDPGEPRLGVIQVNIIAASSPDEIQNAVADLEKRGATHFVLDLRGNRGGVLSSGVDIARLFLVKGAIIQQHYRNQEVETYEVDKPGPLAELPLVVLVNHDTASAAEIVAGALKIQDRAKIIGTPTFGKDSIQLVFSLEDGSSLHVTAAKWWLPGLETPVGEGGIQPDILVSTEESSGDPFIQAAIQAFFNRP
jgi:carboxyl-terminal processing protease